MLFLQHRKHALLAHVRDGGKPFWCFYDIEKAFDSVEIPIPFKHWYKWEIVALVETVVPYSSSSARVRVKGYISNSFTISRGVKQGSVLSPTLSVSYGDGFANETTV